MYTYLTRTVLKKSLNWKKGLSTVVSIILLFKKKNNFLFQIPRRPTYVHFFSNQTPRPDNNMTQELRFSAESSISE